MATDREKEREAELESAMYTNCLLLGLDPTVLGMANGVSGSSPRVGLFRHSNPRLGEQLLYFLLSSLRGSVQSSKDFDKVWPIFDSGQSREFRKVVQGIISELEMQGALPRSNSRVSSLATCCGPRFVELLWQLSVHALREVHRRSFAADVATNPLPPALTDQSYLHAAALLPITKARIALERKKFVENASTAVHRQNTWSNLANEMTAEFRSLCAEEVFLQKELEKLQDMRNKAKSESESWDDRVSSSSGQTSHLVSKSTRLWESLLSRRSQHEVLASGPIEDVIAHREHRYRISGPSLLAAMHVSSQAPYSDGLSARGGELSPSIGQLDKMESSSPQTPQMNGKNDIQPTVDVAEILRRWTHALQRIHRQSLHLAKANGGEGPDILRSALEGDSSGHAESLEATLAEHRQHLVSIQGLINQLKEAIPAMQKSITELTEEVNNRNAMDGLNTGPHLSMQTPNTVRSSENGGDEISEITSKLSPVQIEKAQQSIPAPKLPYLFSLTPNPPGKNSQTLKRNALATQTSREIITTDGNSLSEPSSVNDQKNHTIHETNACNTQDIRRSVREAALSKPPATSSDRSLDRSSDDRQEHFFMPLSTVTGINKKKEITVDTTPTGLRKQRPALYSSPQLRAPRSVTKDNNKTNGLDGFSPVIGGTGDRMFRGLDESLDQVFSPPLLMESSLFQDAYEDLLAPLSETDAALMDH